LAYAVKEGAMLNKKTLVAVCVFVFSLKAFGLSVFAGATGGLPLLGFEDELSIPVNNAYMYIPIGTYYAFGSSGGYDVKIAAFRSGIGISGGKDAAIMIALGIYGGMKHLIYSSKDSNGSSLPGWFVEPVIKVSHKLGSGNLKIFMDLSYVYDFDKMHFIFGGDIDTSGVKFAVGLKVLGKAP